MSFKPVCKPDELPKLKFKDYKPEVAKFVKKMHAKGHTNMENLVPIFLDIEHKFADGEVAMLMVAGKLNTWKNFIKTAISKDPTQVLKGYAFALFSEDTGYELKIAPVKGKMRKENLLDKAFKKLVGSKAIVNLLAEMEESDDFENRMENAVETDETNPNPNAVKTEANNTVSPSEILTLSVMDELKALVGFYKSMQGEKALALLFGDPVDFADTVDRLKLICKLTQDFEKAPEENKLKIRQDAANAIAGHIISYLEVCDGLNNDILTQQGAALRQLEAKIAKFASPITAAKLKISEKQLKGKTFGDRGVAGEQSASDVAKAKRDAEIDEVALELAKLLNLGQNSDSNERFADVIRWVAVASASLKETESKYTAATEKLYKTKSTLGADLRGVFKDTLRGEFIQQMLVDKVSEYASLATALGCLGKTAFARMFSGEKEDAVAIYSGYGTATAQGLVNKIDNFAAAAFDKLTEKQKEQVYSLLRLQQSRDGVAAAKNKTTAQAVANKASDQYLTDIAGKLTQEATFSLDEDKLYGELATWATTASAAEKAAISNPNSKFYKYLLKKKGKKEVDLALHAINKPQLDPKDENFANNETFHKLEKITIEQGHKSSVSRWWNNQETGAEVQKLLLADNMSNPQEAIVSKFLKAKLAEFTKAIPDTASPEQRQTLQAAKDAILKEAIANMNATLDKAGIPKDFKEKIEESILSNGARSLAYQQLAEYAKENPNKIATKVLDVLKELDPTSVEWASIKNDTALLQTLKRHIIKAWLSGYDDWLPIVKLLGLKGDFAADTVDKTAKADKFAQERETSRLKVTSPAEKQKLAEQQAEMQKSATYWAQSIAFKHKKGIFLADALEVMTSVMEAQKNSNWDEVQAELKIINPKALAYVLEFMAKNNTPAKITPATLFEIIAKEDSIFAMNATNMAKFKKTISKMDSIDLLANCFNLKAVETQARAALDKKTQAQEAVTKATTPEEKTKAKAEVDKVNVEVSKTTMDMIKNLDIAPEFTKTLNKIFSPNLAFELKILIRDKVVAQLAGADQAAVKELLPSFSHEEVKLLVEFIRALSSNEKEDMSRTGTQYRGLTSKGQQRDVAAAVHSRELAKAQNVLNSQVYHQMKPKEKAALLKELNGSLQIAGEEKEAKFKSFEETKKKYDERVKKVVSFITGVALKLITAPLESFPFLGTVIEAAVTAIVESITDKILGGDRVGSWKTVLASGTKKFLISLAKGLISQAAPMLLSSVLGASGLLALESGGNRISEAINTIMNSNEKFAGIINTLKETADKVSNALDNNPIANFISNAKDQIAAFQKQIEDNFGLVGKVAVEVVNEQVDEVKAAMSEKVTAFRDKLLTKIDGQRGYLVQALNTVETIQGYYDTAKSAFEAIQSMAAKSRLEKFQAENPDLTGDDLTTAMKGMDDFKDLGDEDWENITSYADMSDKLKTTFDEFVSEQVSGIIDPQLDALMGQAEEDEEIEKLDDNSQLSDGAPKKSLINLRDALKQQGKAIPEFMDALIAKL